MSTQAKEISIYLKHIKDSCNRAIKFTKKANFNKFQKDEMLHSAVIRQLEIIGEATRHIPILFRHKHKEVSWNKMVGMRDKLIHDYIGVDFEVAWKSATIDVPKLRLIVLKILREEFTG